MKRGNTGVPTYMSVARFTGGVVTLLLLLCRCCTARVLLNFRGGVSWSCLSMCSGWHTHIIRPHALAKAPFVAVTKTNTLNYGYCCYAVTATASKAYGVIQAHSSSVQHTTKQKEQ